MTNGEVFYPRVTHQISGNTAGATASISSGTYVLAAGNNVTLSQNGNSVTIVGGASGGGDGGNFIAAGTQTAGSTASVIFSNSNGISFGMSNSSVVTASYTVPSTAGLISNINLSAGTTSNNLSALTFANSNGLTFGLNASTITASHNALTSQSNQAISAGNGSFTFQTASFADSNGVSFSTGTQGIYATVKTDYLTSQSNQAFSASGGSSAFQTLNFANSNGLTFSNSNGSVIASYSVPSTAGLLSNVNLSAGTTSNNLSAFVFSNSNGLSFGLNGSTVTGSHNALTSQSNQAFSASGGSSAFQTLNFANSNGLTFSNSNGSVIASYSVPSTAGLLSAVNLSAGTTSNNLSAFTLSNSNSISFGLNGSVITASYGGLSSQSNQALSGSNGSFTFQTATFGNLNGLSFYTSNGSLVGSHNGLTSQSNQAFSAAGGSSAFQTLGFSDNAYASFTNTNGSVAITELRGSFYAVSNTTQSSSGTQNIDAISFHGAGAVSVGVSNGSVIISGGTAAASPVNFSAGTTSNNLGTVVFSNSNGVSFGLNGSTITASAAGGGGAAISGGTQSVSSGTVIFSNSNGVSFGLSGSQTMTVSVSGLQVYSSYDAYGPSPLVAGQQGQSTLYIQPYIMPSHQYDRVVIPIVMSNASNSSGSHSLTFRVGIYTRNGSTLSLASSTSSSIAITQSGTQGVYSTYGGFRNFTIGSTNTIQAGMYWIGILSATTSGGANASFSQMLVSNVNSNFSGIFGAASNASNQITLGLGVFSAQTAAMPSSIAFSDIRGTGSLALRQPSIFFMSQTA